MRPCSRQSVCRGRPGGGVHARGDAARGLPELVRVRQRGVEGFEHDRARADREHSRGREAAKPGEDFQVGGLGDEHVGAVLDGCFDDDVLAVIELAQPDGVGEPAGQMADAPDVAAAGQDIRGPSIVTHRRPFAFAAAAVSCGAAQAPPYVPSKNL